MKRTLAAAAVLSAAALVTTACSSGADTATGTSSSSAAAPSSSAAAPSSSASASSSAASPSASASSSAANAAASGPVGPGCAAYAAQVPSGAGSVTGMADAPVATAASNNPLLTTLVSAVSGGLNPQVDLVDTLNGSQFTVFAPVDSAFAAVPASTLDSLKSDSALLTKVLTYHVVSGRLSPEQVIGTQTTVEGQTVSVTGTPDDLEVNGAQVICGGVQTANATVYLIDGVLTPPAS